MRKYILKFKYNKTSDYLYLPITATLEHKAIEEVEEFIQYEKERGKPVIKGKLIKHTERDEIVWGMEQE